MSCNKKSVDLVPLGADVGFFPQEVGAKIHQKSVALFLGDPQKSRQKRLGFLDSLEVWVLKRRVFLFSDGILGAFKRAPTT